MTLIPLAESLRTALGPSFHFHRDYEFAIPTRDKVSVGRVDAAIFSSAAPSIHSATIGFHSSNGQNDGDGLGVDRFAYLGAPLFVRETAGSLALFRFSQAAYAEIIAEQQTPQWVRERVLEDMESAQFRLPFAASRDLLIQDTRNALERSISALTHHAKLERNLNDSDSFRVAMAVIRSLFLPGFEGLALSPTLTEYADSLARRVTGTLSFANVPAESIAELYETFAVGDSDRRRSGVVYTPAWLARYVVDLLPQEAFTSGRTLDPACGSGTFLVCFLERVVERANREGRPINADLLQRSICGIDVDPVAIEAARLSLDMFIKTMKLSSVDWDLSVADATAASSSAEWLVGNLPFGYRTYKRKSDLSSAILTHIHAANPRLQAMSLILPDSLAYTKAAQSARTLLRSSYNVQEVTRLPERVFERSKAATMVLTARKGTPDGSLLVREVHEENLPSFRAGIRIGSSFYADFPASLGDPWSFSPFSNEFEKASGLGHPLADVAETRLGLQIYGTPSPFSGPLAGQGRPLLTAPTTFATWTATSIHSLLRLTASREAVRRRGPWDMFHRPKVIVRSTTRPKTSDRLAAIPDTQGVGFTDKFIGIWPKEGSIDIQALAAYLQTRFARAWYETKNPSRKLRVSILLSLPIPRLPPDWWARAADLAPADRVVSPERRRGGDEELMFNGEQENEWTWFNASVEAAFGLDSVSGSRLEKWLAGLEGSEIITPV